MIKLLPNLLLLIANALALGLLLLKGGKAERIAAICVVLTIVSEPFAQGIQIGTWRLGILVVNLGLLASFWTLAEICNRWWLILAAALQLLIVLSAMMPLMATAFDVDTGVVVRMLLWGLVSLTLFLGVVEAVAARRFALEAQMP